MRTYKFLVAICERETKKAVEYIEVDAQDWYWAIKKAFYNSPNSKHYDEFACLYYGEALPLEQIYD